MPQSRKISNQLTWCQRESLDAKIERRFRVCVVYTQRHVDRMYNASTEHRYGFGQIFILQVGRILNQYTCKKEELENLVWFEWQFFRLAKSNLWL